MRPAFCAVALLALACLLPRVFSIGIAGDYVDPVSRITAQDEALYGHSAIAMARGGDWLTPHFLGRLALYKLFYDPWLESRAALWTFAACNAAAILTKGIAGCFPLLVLVLYSLAARRDQRPTVVRTLQAFGISAALAAPWFVYQLAAHPR